MDLSYDEMTKIAKEAGGRHRAWASAVTEEDRIALKERFGVDSGTHEIFRGPLPAWESSFVVGECTFVVVDDGQTAWF